VPLRLDQFEPCAESREGQSFISHSHRDLEKVRQIRNERERRGHPSFSLKCLMENDATLPELIRYLKTGEME